ncbi:hypothetical protein VNO77_42745 [Canavalia gladiata]|uniref:SWIRM domain-containing protein n=1 Tax=Canavalia gladiata TaxID=3824 RepID=A0AAN9JWF4_CANGL
MPWQKKNQKTTTRAYRNKNKEPSGSGTEQKVVVKGFDDCQLIPFAVVQFSMEPLALIEEARIAGCVTAAEAYQFIEQKRTKEAELSACKESGQIGTSAKTIQRSNYLKGELESSPRGLQKGATGLFAGVKDSPTVIQAITRSLEEWDISGFVGAELLSESEKNLCKEIRMLPSHYLNMLQTMSLEISKGNVKKKSDAHTLFKVDPNKVDRVYDMLVKKGVVQA